MTTVLVTGATSGIGKETALAFASEFQVIAIGRNKKELATLQKQKNIKTYECDITKSSQVKSLFATIDSLDILINCAGVIVRKELENTSDEQIKAMMDTNLTAVFLVTKYALPLLKKSNSPLIINISSLAAKSVRGGLSVYGASKYGLFGFADAIPQETGIRVTTILPGRVNTPMQEWPKDHSQRSEMLQASEVADACLYVAKLPSHICIPALEMLYWKR